MLQLYIFRDLDGKVVQLLALGNHLQTDEAYQVNLYHYPINPLHSYVHYVEHTCEKYQW